MDSRTRRISRLAGSYDRKLYAIRTPQGMIQIWREGDRPDVTDLDLGESYVLRPNPQFILALTDTWTLSGNPVEWGIEPLSNKIRAMDSWSHDVYDEFSRERERKAEDTKRQKKNERRAIATDMRRDFAKAMNDVNV